MEQIESHVRLSEIYVSRNLRYKLAANVKTDFLSIVERAKEHNNTWLIVGYDGMTVRRQQNVFFVGIPYVHKGEIHVKEIKDPRLSRRIPYWNLVIRIGFLKGLQVEILGKFKEIDAPFTIDMIHAIPSEIIDFVLIDGRVAIEKSIALDIIDESVSRVIIPRIWDPMTKKNWLPGWEIRTVESSHLGKLVWNKKEKKREWDDDTTSVSYILNSGERVISYRELFGPVFEMLERQRGVQMDDEQRRKFMSLYNNIRRLLRDRPPLVLDLLSKHLPMSKGTHLDKFYIKAYYTFISPAVIVLKDEKSLQTKSFLGTPELETLEFGSEEEEIVWLTEPESTPQVPTRIEFPTSIEVPRLVPTETYQRPERTWSVYESPMTIPTLPKPQIEERTRISVPSFPIEERPSPKIYPQIRDLPRGQLV